jgi:hypothetical protein
VAGFINQGWIPSVFLPLNHPQRRGRRGPVAGSDESGESSCRIESLQVSCSLRCLDMLGILFAGTPKSLRHFFHFARFYDSLLYFLITGRYNKS